MTSPVPADWLARLRLGLLPSPQHDSDSGARPPQPAAVLVPIVDRTGGPTVLLTARAVNLRQHAGQISFPGGRIEPHDASECAAALRESHEEIGLDAASIAVLGYLPDHIVLTGYRITPVIGLLRPDFVLRVDDAEVAEVFEVPLSVICVRQNFVPRHRLLRGVEVTLLDLIYEGRTIWGATAVMLLALQRTLNADQRSASVTA